jgi:hypothetical protein
VPYIHGDAFRIADARDSVLAEEIERAYAFPKDVRYRSTPRRHPAERDSRENLKKALEADKPAPPPRHGTF